MTEDKHSEDEENINEEGPAMGAKRCHWYPYQEVLKGRLTKESLSVEVLKWMEFEHRHWTNPKFADNPSPNMVRQTIIDNVRREVELAIAEFISRYGDENKSSDL
jgi:hypothetical protein